VPDAISGYFEGDTYDAPQATEGVVAQNESEEEWGGLTEAFRSSESEDNRLY